MPSGYGGPPSGLYTGPVVGRRSRLPGAPPEATTADLLATVSALTPALPRNVRMAFKVVESRSGNAGISALPFKTTRRKASNPSREPAPAGPIRTLYR